MRNRPIFAEKFDQTFLTLIIRIIKENSVFGIEEKITELYERIKMNTEFDSFVLRILLDILSESSQVPEPLKSDFVTLRDALKNADEVEVKNLNILSDFLKNKMRQQ